MATRAKDQELNDREIAFCREYARTLNATRSYLAAYKDTTYESAGVEAVRVLKKPRIREYLGEILNLNEPVVLNEIIKIASAQITDVFEVSVNKDGFIGATIKPTAKWSDRAKAAVKSVKINQRTGEVTLTFHDRLKALEMLMRKLNLYPSQQAIIDALSRLSAEGLLVQGQAEVISEGLSGIEDNLKRLSSGEDKQAE